MTKFQVPDMLSCLFDARRHVASHCDLLEYVCARARERERHYRCHAIKIRKLRAILSSLFLFVIFLFLFQEINERYLIRNVWSVLSPFVSRYYAYYNGKNVHVQHSKNYLCSTKVGSPSNRYYCKLH